MYSWCWGEGRMIKIIIPFKTPTVNHLYWHKGNMKILTTKAREFRKKIEKIINDSSMHLVPKKDAKLKVLVEVHENWLTKVGTIRKKDLMNREKFLIDSVFGTLNTDDKFIYELTMKKIQSEKEFTVVVIEELNSEQ